MRDLTDASATAIAAERARVPREGIGEAIVARQGSDGSWHRADAPVWLPTLDTLLFLRSTGVDRTEPAVESAVARLEAGFRWDKEFGEKPFFEGEVEPCINGSTLALGAYFGRPTESLARRLVSEQLDYLRDAGVQPDTRVGDACEVVERRRQADGRWLLDGAYDEALALPFGESLRGPSRWNTLRALRVLGWYERKRRLEPASIP